MKKILSLLLSFCMILVLGTSCNNNERNESQIKNYEEIKLEKEYQQIQIAYTEESAGFVSEDGSIDLLDKDFKIKKNLKLELKGKKKEKIDYIYYPSVFFDGKNIYVDKSPIDENEIDIYDINGEIIKTIKFNSVTYLRKVHDFENRTFFEMGEGYGQESINKIIYIDENYNFVEVPGLEFVKNMGIANSFKVDENSFMIVYTEMESDLIKIVTIKDDLTFEIREDDMSEYNNSDYVPYLEGSLYVKSKDTFYRSSMVDNYLEKFNKDGTTEIISEEIQFFWRYNINEVFYLANYKNEKTDKIFKYYPLKETKKDKNKEFIKVYTIAGESSRNETLKYAKKKMKEEGIDVIFVDKDYDAYVSEVNLKLSAGDKDIDLFMNDSFTNYKYISNSYTDTLNDYKDFMKVYEKNVNQSVNNVVTFDKKIYGIPLQIQVGSQIAINEKNLSDKGIKVPKETMEYDEFITFAKEVKEKDPDSFSPLYLMYTIYLGNYIGYNYDDGINNINKEELKKLYIDGKEMFAGITEFTEPNENSNILQLYKINENNAKYFTPLKEIVTDKKKPETSSYANILSVYNGSEKKEWCEKFLTYCIEKENLILNTNPFEIPILKDISDYKDTYPKDYYEYLEKSREVTNYSMENTRSKYMVDNSEIMYLTESYFSGELTDVDEVVNSIYDLIDKQVKE